MKNNQKRTSRSHPAEDSVEDEGRTEIEIFEEIDGELETAPSPLSVSPDDYDEDITYENITEGNKNDVDNNNVHQTNNNKSKKENIELEITNEMIKKQYENKIKNLLSEVITTDDLDMIEKKNKLINVYKKTIKEMEEKHDQKDIEKTTIKNNNNNEKIISNNEIPFFQLKEDPISLRNEKKICYENAETFTNAFETIIKINELDINKVWKKHLAQAFLFSKNDKYTRWYQTHINNLHDSESWENIKERIINRFDDSNNLNNNIDRYLNMRQGKTEHVREYMDRYLESYYRLPRENDSTMVDAARFIHSLLPRTKEEVIISLKRNKKDEEVNHVPKNLPTLFKYLENNIGDIQEALYLSLTKNENTKKREINNKDENDTFKKQKNNSQSEEENPGYKKCKHCKAKPFSYEHLKTCVEYLKSDDYARYLVRKNEYKKNKQENYNNKVPILFIQKEEIKDTNYLNNYREVHNEIDNNILENFNSIMKIVKFDSVKYHNQFATKNSGKNNNLPIKFDKKNNNLPIKYDKKSSNLPVKIQKNNNAKSESILIKNTREFETNNTNDYILCYSIDVDKKIEELSPYSPMITIHGENFVSILDTGASVSLINIAYDFYDRSILDDIIPTVGRLMLANKNSFTERIGKTQPLKISYRGKPVFTHCFELIELPQKDIPILIGRDLIPKLGITIHNIAHTFDEKEEIIYKDTADEDTYVPNISKACSEEEYEKFMEKMKPVLLANANINVHELCPLKEAKVFLKTKPNEVAFTRQYPVAYALQPVVKKQINKWAEDRTIEPAQPSAFNSPLTLVPKPNGSDGTKKWRVCLDTRRINNLMEDVSNVNTPLIDDIFHNVRESKIFSVFDISGAFHRLEINESDRHKLSFTFEGKTWMFRGACFGLKSLSGIFQNVMETIFAEMKEFTCIYIDDLVCHSKDLRSHEIHCKKVIEALTKYKLPINQEKTHLARNSIYLLGFCISEEGKTIDARRLVNIDEWEKPKTPKAMMKFCGWVSYMRAHLPNASELTAPLDHLRYSTKKTLEWTPEMHTHYESIINIIKHNIVLSHPNLNHPFSLAVDASQYSVGSCLFQEYTEEGTGKKTIKYIGFASKALSKSQRSYSVTKKELYALTTGLKRFYKFLHGDQSFNCYTDHRSLQYIFTTKQASMMLLRYMEIILSFPNMKVIWIPGIENVMSDKLSRLFPGENDRIVFEKEDKKLFPEYFQQARKDKNKKSKLRLLNKKESKKGLHKKKNENNLPSQNEFTKHNQINEERIPHFYQYFISTEDNKTNIPEPDHYVKIKTWSIKTIHDVLIEEETIDTELIEDIQINYLQKMDESFIIPPEEERNDILKTAHEFGHYGAEAIVQRIRKDEGMNWPKIINDAIEIVKQCSSCQKFVITKKGYNPLRPLYCYSPGFHYQMDLCGPFPVTTSNNAYILVLLDVATRFIVLRPIVDKSAKTVSKELISIFSLIGYPRILNSDRGTEWRNQILDHICEAMKIDKRLSTAYYSQGNGGAERAVQNAKKLLSKLILGVSEDNWDLVINSVQLMINCKVSKRLLTSPFNLMFARKMTNEYPLFNDPKDDLEPMDNDELLKRIEYMSDIVFPAIKERTEIYNKMLKNQFDKRHRLVDFPVGSFVVVHKKGIQKSLSPVYEGPYEVVRKTERGNYTLRDELGLLLPREHTPSELKLVSQDAIVSKEEVYEFDAIVDHRGDPGKREYKIRWKNYTAKDDTWITTEMFTDPQAIVNYWKRIKGSVHKADEQQINKISSTDSDLPPFDKHKKGKMLNQIVNIPDSIPTSTNPKNNKTVNRRGYIKTSTRTKPQVKHNPAQSLFRRSLRTKKPTFKPAVDATRYRK